MYRECPKCGYERQAQDTAPATECPACGLLYSKWMKQRFSSAESAGPAAPRAAETGSALWMRLVHVEPSVNLVSLYGRFAVYVFLFIWGWHFIGMDHSVVAGGGTEIGNSFMHRVNLVFHEAGHVIFMPLGRFMAVLGGTLGQWLMPLIVLIAFLVKNRDPFGASVGLWWLGQSFMDAAPYIHDARARELLLLGGVTGRDRPGYHDWENILGSLGWLELDHQIASLVNGIGVFMMLLAFVWGAYVLYLQYRNRDTRYG